MVRVLGVLVSIFLCFAAFKSTEFEPVFLFGALFFLVLSVGTLFKSKYMYLFIAGAFISFILMQLYTGEALGLRYSSSVKLADDPSAYWARITYYAIFALIALSLGVYESFFKKTTEQPYPVNTVMQDLDSVGNLITETSTAYELEQKARSLFSELEKKYKTDNVALTGIKASKDFISEEIIKRKLDESRKTNA